MRINEYTSNTCCNKVLIVDDSPFNVNSLSLMLKYRFGLQSDAAYSGFEAIRLIENRYEKLHRYDCSEKYQLILTDINMPEMDGI